MAWPGITDFSEALQNPSLCFQGTDLEAATVSVNQRGTPLIYSGAFACVYSVTEGSQTFAVRCFTREVNDQQSRYNDLSNYLINVLPPSFVHFEYREEGIRFKGDWYPMVKMEWVEGEVLSSFVDSRLDDPDALRRVAAQWRGGPTASLRGLRIAHNDLQHGNVMVQNDGRIRLVDYDGMFLPQFKGERSPELGHKNYQHPERTADDYSENIDYFPSLVVYLSLLAVASDADLWEFNNEDNLIFTRDDYSDPGGSDLFKRLKRSSDKTVARLAESLEECCGMSVDDVPDLETILSGVPQSTVPVAPAPTAAPSSSSTPASAQTAAAPSTPPQSSGVGFRQVPAAQPSTPPQPAGVGFQQVPAVPITPTQPVGTQIGTQPSATQGVPCSICNTSNQPTAANCINCGVQMPMRAVAPVPPSRRPSLPRRRSANPRPVPASSTVAPRAPLTVSAAQLQQNFKEAVAELRHNARYYEYGKVALGVGITAVTVFVLLLAVLALAILQAS